MASNISRLPIRNAHASAAGRYEPGGLRARAAAAAEIAARFADEVDRDGRFPKEAFDAIREQKLLGVLIPAALGGEDASVADVVDVCYILGRACASTALIYAMHQVKVGCLVRHAGGNVWQEGLQRRIAEKQLLMASSTTEGANGGNIRSSEAAIQHQGFAHRPGAQRLGHFLWRTCRRHRHDRAARRERRQFGPGARRVPERRLLVGAHPILGHAGDARNLQRRLHPARAGRAGPNPPRTLRSNPQSDDDAARPSVLERRVERGRRRSGAAGARLRAQGRARLGRQAAAGRRASDASAGFARNAARRAAVRDAEIRASFERSARPERDRRADRVELPESGGFRACGDDRDGRDARLRPFGLSQRQRIRDGSVSARHPLLADHDQQRPHPRRRAGRCVDERRCRPD